MALNIIDALEEYITSKQGEDLADGVTVEYVDSSHCDLHAYFQDKDNRTVTCCFVVHEELGHTRMKFKGDNWDDDDSIEAVAFRMSVRSFFNDFFLKHAAMLVPDSYSSSIWEDTQSA
ncbi:MAG: hypothetical protein GW898_10615 [Thiomicrospira sp.]|nr:hypothetical protein [Thiomicrospira sp.]NCO14809.1 hypothetical protein [Thiomicrospira sp.]NCO82405.1 hypothetical protein [Thiomicrospira sp.]OIP95466.1 MAG: hypothetical protein AUK56_05345 [Thiomicrospira sp. CG2_30_44_34]